MGQTTEQLWDEYEAGSEKARAALLDRFLGLVHHVARQISRGVPDEVELDDLVSAGTLGLVLALQSFDRSRGLAFSTYATPRIHGSILDDLRSRDWVPRSVRSKARRIAAAIGVLQTELRRVPRPEEIALVLGVDAKTFARWQEEVDGAVLMPLDASVVPGEQDAISFEETIADPKAKSPDFAVTQVENINLLKGAIASLPPKERSVLALYYYEELNLRQIAEVLHLTESRISQIRTSALSKLRSLMDPGEPAGATPVRKARTAAAR